MSRELEVVFKLRCAEGEGAAIAHRVVDYMGEPESFIKTKQDVEALASGFVEGCRMMENLKSKLQRGQG